MKLLGSPDQKALRLPMLETLFVPWSWALYQEFQLHLRPQVSPGAPASCHFAYFGVPFVFGAVLEKGMVLQGLNTKEVRGKRASGALLDLGLGQVRLVAGPKSGEECMQMH